MTRLRIAGALVVLAITGLLVVGIGWAAPSQTGLNVKAVDGVWTNSLAPGQKLSDWISINNFRGTTYGAFTATLYLKGQKLRRGSSGYNVKFQIDPAHTATAKLVSVSTKMVVFRISGLASTGSVQMHFPVQVTAEAGTHVCHEKAVLTGGAHLSTTFPCYDVAQTNP